MMEIADIYGKQIVGVSFTLCRMLTFPYLELVKFVQLDRIFSCKHQNFLSGSRLCTFDYRTIAVNIIQNCRLKCLDIYLDLIAMLD